MTNSAVANSLELFVDGQSVRLPVGASVAAALAHANAMGGGVARTSVTGEARAPVCGMGICQECRVTIDGKRRLACQTLCVQGMRVELGR
jgi:D-hydroxyproline dehydrogenase subunit gamma